MNKQTVFLLIVVLLTCGESVAAPGPDQKFHAQGVFLFNVTTEASTTEVDFEEGKGLAAYVGYHFLPRLAIELGAMKFDPAESVEVDNEVALQTEFESTGYTLGIKAIGSFYDLFDYWAAAGLYKWDSTLNYELNYRSFPNLRRFGSNRNSGEDVYYRLGVSTPLMENLIISVEISQFELTDFFSGIEDGNTDFKQRTIGLGIETYF